MNHSYGHDGLKSAYFVYGVYDGDGIFPSEFQSDISILFSVNEVGYSLVTGGIKAPRTEALPLSKDGLFYNDVLSIVVS